MENLTIRQFKLNEIDKIMEIWYESNINTHYFVEKRHWEDIFDRVKKRLINSKNVYVYVENDTIKGFICIDEDGYIPELYVDSKYRSLGIGKKLLDFAKKNNKEVFLHVFEKNKRAIDFYIREGFMIVSKEKEEETNENGFFMKWKN